MKKSLRLNSVSEDIFRGKNTQDVCVETCGMKISRKELVGIGAMLASDTVGLRLNEEKHLDLESYRPKLESHRKDMAAVSSTYRDKLFAFCAASAYEAEKRPLPTNLSDYINDRSLCKNSAFLRVLAGIVQDVITPLYTRVFDDVSGRMLEMKEVGLGETREIKVKSNDIFLFQDSAWGASRSVPKNRLYAKTYTLTPQPKSCNATIDWYQDVVNGEPGDWYAAIMRGMWNKIYAEFTSKLITAAKAATSVTSALQYDTYTNSNWTNLTTSVAAANGLRREDLFAFGMANALSQIIPDTGTAGAMTGLQMGLGEQWFTNGYLTRANRVDLFEVQPAVVPHTQNTTLTYIFPDDVVFVAAKAANGYAPMQGAIAAGTPITLMIDPSQSANMALDINVTIAYDIAPVFASKIGYLGSL